LAACLAAVAVVTACDRTKSQLLAPQNPGLVDPSAVGSPTAALALRIGAIGRYKQVQSGESIWEYAGVLVDEFSNADFNTDRINVDQRIADPLVQWGYSGTTQSRGFIRDAIAAMKQYNPDSLALISELYTELAFIEMTLADNFCNGIPLGHTTNGVQVNGAPLTTAQVYDSALTHLDSAISTVKGTDAGSIYVLRAAQVFKARVLVAKGQFSAVNAVTASIPTSYIYDMTFSSATGSNGHWTLNNSVARVSVGDSFKVVGGQSIIIQNALPFASANDPRVPVLLGSAVTPKVAAEDGITTPLWLGQLYKNQYDPMVLASGVDARLYEAEAALNAKDITGMMTILNALRAAGPTVAATKIPVMAPLPTPTSQDAATSLLFREKAFWTFGRGQRLPDLRRLVRQYGRTDAQVFPTGAYFKGGNYGTDENFPVPSQEQVNPLFTSCLDRKA
jgi:starch-binding outer membrane protein, SusD/RagB family